MDKTVLHHVELADVSCRAGDMQLIVINPQLVVAKVSGTGIIRAHLSRRTMVFDLGFG